MKTKKEYPLEIFFMSREDPRDSLGNPLPDGRYIIIFSLNYKAFYDPRKNKIVAEFEGKNMEEIVKARLEFEKVAQYRLKDKIKKQVERLEQKLRHD